MTVNMLRVLTSNDLDKMPSFEYKFDGISLLEPPLRIFWNWLGEKLPSTIAPNTLTLLGLATNVTATLIVVLCSPNASDILPWWANCVCAVSVLLYQILDALDGYQGRKFNQQTALEELFDHGCDALSSVLITINLGICLGLGTNPIWLLGLVVASMYSCYLVHWHTNVCGYMKFKRIDVTEGQVMAIGIHLVTAMYGSSIWENKIPFAGIELKHMLVWIAATVVFCDTYDIIHRIQEKRRLESNVSTVQSSPLPQLLPIVIVCASVLVTQAMSPSHVFERNPCLYLISFGIVAAKICNKMIVASLSHREIAVFDTVFLGPAALLLNGMFRFVNEDIILWLFFVYAAVQLVTYFSIVAYQMCDHMNLPCFTIVSSSESQPKPNGVMKHD